MVVGIDDWKAIRTSLMKDVSGFTPNPVSCRTQAMRRSNSLNSLQSLCSTTFSSDDDVEVPTGCLNQAQLAQLPDGKEDEDWRMFGWLLDSAEASCSRSPSPSCEFIPCYSPLPPLEIPPEAALPEASDLLEICQAKRKGRAFRSCGPSFEDFDYTARSRKRSSATTVGFTEDSDILGNRLLTHDLVAYSDHKRRRELGAAMHEDSSVYDNSMQNDEATYYYQGPVKEEVSQGYDDEDSQMVDIKTEASYPESATESVMGSENRRGILFCPGFKRTTKKTGRPTKKEVNKLKRDATKDTKKSKGHFNIGPATFKCKCGKEYDPTKDMVACTQCGMWSHAKCYKISAKSAEKITTLSCADCKQKAHMERLARAGEVAAPETTEAEYTDTTFLCLCNSPHDPSRTYIGCDVCSRWFHPECVQTTPAQVEEQGGYICPGCYYTQEPMGIEDETIEEEDDEESLNENTQ